MTIQNSWCRICGTLPPVNPALLLLVRHIRWDQILTAAARKINQRVLSYANRCATLFVRPDVGDAGVKPDLSGWSFGCRPPPDVSLQKPTRRKFRVGFYIPGPTITYLWTELICGLI